MQFSVLLTLALALVFSGCGIQALDAVSSNDNNGLQASQLQESNLMGLFSEVTCESSDQCPGPIGMLVRPVADEGSRAVGWCTVGMVGERVAVTNGHCIPPDLRGPGVSCEQRLWVSFPSNRVFASQVVECESIVYSSLGYEEQDSRVVFGEQKPDYAFIRLKSAPARGTLRLTSEDISPGSIATVFKVNPDRYARDRVRGVLERIDCKVDQSLTVSLKSKSGMKPSEQLSEVNRHFAQLSDCDIIPGNSGSPVIVDNKVPGVAFAASPSEKRAYVTKFFSVFLPRVED